MPPKVASIFGGKVNRAKTAEAVYSAKKDEVIDLDSIEKSDDNYQQLLSAKIKVEDPKKPKYIFAALEKADERRAFADEMKNLNLEREIKKLEEKDGPYIRFYTDGTQDPKEITEEEFKMVENEEQKENQNEELDQQKLLQKKIEEVDIEGMRQRYMERLNEKDILKLQIKPKRMKLILHYHEIAKL